MNVRYNSKDLKNSNSFIPSYVTPATTQPSPMFKALELSHSINMFDIIELQHELTRNRIEATKNSNEENYFTFKARTARRDNDIDMLLKRGSSPCQPSPLSCTYIFLISIAFYFWLKRANLKRFVFGLERKLE